jgi:hypothetical protein
MMPVSNSAESHLLEFYHIKIAPSIGGCYQRTFWSEKILALALEEPAVRIALIAFSSIYEIGLLRKTLPKRILESQIRTFIEYHNLAIKELISKLDSPWPVRAPLIVSILFFCIDILRGDLPLAMKHLRGCLELYSIWKNKPRDSPDIDKLDIAFIDDRLMFTLNWLNMISAMFGERYVPLNANHLLKYHGHSPANDVAETFSNIQDAQASLVTIIDEGVRIIQTIENLRAVAALFGSGEGAIQELILSYFDLWSIKFERMVAENSSKWPNSTLHGVNITRAGYLTVRLWVKGSASKYESEWDQFKSDFEQILYNIEIYLVGVRQYMEEGSDFFCFELMCIPGLHLVLSKCRYPRVRRLALRLLSICPQKEVIFDSINSSVLYQAMMEAEEEGIRGLTAGEEPREDQLPPEGYRVHKIEIPPLQSTRDGTTVNFFMKPNGLENSWHVKASVLRLENPQLVRWYVYTSKLKIQASTNPGQFMDSPARLQIDRMKQTNVNFSGLMVDLVTGKYDV